MINSKSHTDIAELGRRRDGPGRFPYWSMCWMPVEPGDLRIAEVSDWRGLAYRDEAGVFQVSTGIERFTKLVTPFVYLNLIRRGSDGRAHFRPRVPFSRSLPRRGDSRPNKDGDTTHWADSSWTRRGSARQGVTTIDLIPCGSAMRSVLGHRRRI